MINLNSKLFHSVHKSCYVKSVPRLKYLSLNISSQGKVRDFYELSFAVIMLINLSKLYGPSTFSIMPLLERLCSLSCRNRTTQWYDLYGCTQYHFLIAKWNSFLYYCSSLMPSPSVHEVEIRHWPPPLFLDQHQGKIVGRAVRNSQVRAPVLCNL